MKRKNHIEEKRLNRVVFSFLVKRLHLSKNVKFIIKNSCTKIYKMIKLNSEDYVYFAIFLKKEERKDEKITNCFIMWFNGFIISCM